MSEKQIKRAAPNLNMFLWRPIIADPPIYNMQDLRELTLSEVMDAHEALNLRIAVAEQATESGKS